MAFVYWIHLPEHTDMFSEGYIGFTSKTVEGRWKQHKDDSKRYPHLTLYKALSKYGEKLVVTTLVEGSDNYCLDLENKLRPKVKIGWNIKIGGDFGSLGVTASEETRKKQSECRIGEKNHFFGKTHTDEVKAKMSLERTGREVSQETREKQSKARLGKKMNLTDEQRKARSERSSAKKNSPETRAKISASRLGIKISAEASARKSLFLTQNPWCNPRANKYIWAQCKDIYNLRESGATRVKAAESIGIKAEQLGTIWVKLKAGWIPNEDALWLSFVEEFNELKEAENAQTA